MPDTYVIYSASSGQTDFDIVFDRVSDSHVEVLVNAANTDAFSILADTVTLDVPSTEGDQVELRRRTPDDPEYDFVAASSYNAQDTQDAYTQTLYRSTEILEQTDRRLSALVDADAVTANAQKFNGNGGKAYTLSERAQNPNNILVSVSGQVQVPSSAMLDDPTDPLVDGGYSLYDDAVNDETKLVFPEIIPVGQTIDVWYLTQTEVSVPDVVVSTVAPVDPGTQEGQLWAVVPA